MKTSVRLGLAMLFAVAALGLLEPQPHGFGGLIGRCLGGGSLGVYL